MSFLEVFFAVLGFIGLGSFLILIRKVREFLINIVHTKIGIVNKYKTRDIAIKKNWDLIKSSIDIKILNFKGYSLINLSLDEDTRFETLLNDKIKHSFKFLLLNPSSSAYIKKRIDQLGEQNTKSIEDHQKNIKGIIEKIRLEKSKDPSCAIECRLFSEVLKWSLIILDNNLLISFYLDKKQNIAPCYLLKKDSPLGTALTRHFDDIWDNKSKDALTSYNKFCIVALVGGSYMGKSIIAHHIAEKYDFSGVICTDMIRNQSLCETKDTILFSTSTPTMEDKVLKQQQKKVSDILLNIIAIYKDRGEKIVVEGMHFTNDILDKLSSSGDCLILGIDNTLPLTTRLDLKKSTTRPNCKTKYPEKEERRMATIHSNLLQSVTKDNIITYTDIEAAKRSCDDKVEEFFSKLK